MQNGHHDHATYYTMTILPAMNKIMQRLIRYETIYVTLCRGVRLAMADSPANDQKQFRPSINDTMREENADVF